MDVNSCSEAILHQDIINLVVVVPILAVPCPSSGWFVRAKGVCQYQVVKGCIQVNDLLGAQVNDLLGGNKTLPSP